MSTFTASKILPESFPALDDDALEPPPLPQTNGHNGLDAHVFDDIAEEEHLDSEARRPQSRQRFSQDNLSSFDLAPPPPSVSHTNAELLAEKLFSASHLDLILEDNVLFRRFANFLNRYRASAVPTLVRYLESQKAISAIRYANAVAEQLPPNGNRSSSTKAGIIDPKFESRSRRALEELVNDALPAYITYRLVNVVTECLVKEITGNNAPIMKDLVQGLAEVYCMSDPSLPDNPIVFASEEFYNTTQYGMEYAIGRNCRFLQGPKSSHRTVTRLSEALKQGQEICETLLNYRRDGTPFLNLLMMAPLYDNKGAVRYFIGCQIDISHLIEGGRGLESFQQLLTKEQEQSPPYEKPLPDPLASKPSLKALGDLGQMLNKDEMEALKQHGRCHTMDSERSTPTRHQPARRFVGMEDTDEPSYLPPGQFGSSGRLPGVYQNFLLVRPYPSFRIIFTSASLRIPGLSQSRLLDRIGGPQHIRDGISDALASGVGVTAKVSWLTHVNPHSHEGTNGDGSMNGAMEGKPRWIHCTPLLGSDQQVGVWMVVMVEKEEVTGTLNSRTLSHSSPSNHYSPYRGNGNGIEHGKDGWPPRGTSMGVSAASARFTSTKLYADYLKREGRTESPEGLMGRMSMGSSRGSERQSPSLRRVGRSLEDGR